MRLSLSGFSIRALPKTIFAHFPVAPSAAQVLKPSNLRRAQRTSTDTNSPSSFSAARSMRTHALLLQASQLVALLVLRGARRPVRAGLQARKDFPGQIPFLAGNINRSHVELVFHIALRKTDPLPLRLQRRVDSSPL